MDSGQIIITGGAGFVGRHLVVELLRSTPPGPIEIWDRHIDDVPVGVSARRVDITDPSTYTDYLALRPAWIIHLAAISSVMAANKNPDHAFALNVEATRRLLETTAQVSPQTRFFITSSADIYGQGSDTPLPELPLSQAKPRNPYGQSKWEMEKMIEDNFNDRVIRVRPFPHIGPGQQLGFVTADFASQIAAIEAGRQEPVLKVGNLEAKRDFTDVRDVVRAYRLLLQPENLGQVFHVASGKAVAIKTIAQQLLSLSDQAISLVSAPDRIRAADVPILVGDATALHRATQWQPTIPLEQSLRDILTDWRERIGRSA